MISFKRNNLIKYIFFFDLILIFAILVSFLQISNKESSEKKTTALLNPKYRDSVYFIEIENPLYDEKIYLEKNNFFWMGTNKEKEFFFPANTESVNNLISQSCSLVDMYKKTNKKKNWEHYNLSEEEANLLKFYDKNHNLLSTIYFGSKDSMTNRIAVRFNENDFVWEINSSIDMFLKTKEHFWASPYIYPTFLYNDFETDNKYDSLRRGQISFETVPKKDNSFVIEKLFENGNKVKLNIYKKDLEYFVVPEFIVSPGSSNEKNKFFNKINYRYKISETTLNRIMNLDYE